MRRFGKLILHFNTPELTEQLCDMVPGAIVIDNGSTTAPYTGKNRCIRQPDLGFTRGWNQAIQTLWDEFDIFWLMNSDIRVDRVSLMRIEQLAQRDGGPEFFTPSFNCWMKHVQSVPSLGLAPTYVMEFTAPVISRKVFDRLGMWDERFSLGYGVEFDFCYRARVAGVKMWVDHLSRFYHLGQQTIGQSGGILPYSARANAELSQGLREKYGPKFRQLVLNGLSIKTDLAMKIAIYTTIFDSYDTLKPIPQQDTAADLFVITDNPDLKMEGWTTLTPSFPRKDLHPRLRAKYFKMMPWELEELKAYPVTIYIDASIRITSSGFVSTCLKNLSSDMLLFKHPDRQCIYDEAQASVGLIKYHFEPIQEQVDFYQRFHPRQAGLYACGILIRRNTERLRQVMGDWWMENIKFSYQDQLSLPVVLRARGITPSVFQENQYKNSFLRVEWHDDKTVRDKIPQFSVLMPVWKTDPQLILRAVDSILNQNFRDFELIIVDDNNQDPEIVVTLATIEAINPQMVKVVRTPENNGLASTLDFGLKHCRGRWVVRMDSDDWAYPSLLFCHHEFFTRNPQARICGIQLNLCEGGRTKNVTNHPATVTLDKVLDEKIFWFINHPGVCYDRETIQQVGGYGDTPFDMPEDYALWIKLIRSGVTLYNNPRVLMDYTLGDGTQLGQKRKSDEWKQFMVNLKKTLTP